jgi:hypothetical protein
MAHSNAVLELRANDRSGRILLLEFLEMYGSHIGSQQTDWRIRTKYERQMETRKKEGKEPESTGGIHMCHMIPRTRQHKVQ